MADIFVANGAGMETFISKALQQAPSLKIVEASKGIELVDHDNPHIWVSVSGAIQETKNVAAGIGRC